MFPISCVVCGREGAHICESCLIRLPRIPQQLCVVCKKSAAFGKTHPDCHTCHTVDGLISAISYTDTNAKKLIGVFKYEFIHDLAEPLAKLITETVANLQLGNYFSNFAIIPVPLHRRRYNWRGFNQSELLAYALGVALNIPVDKNLVSRSKKTKPQTTLNKEDRIANISAAFTLNAAVPGKYLLVDDVVTTGATLNEIAKLLKKNGAQEVWAATIAHG
ncbi:MAG TPA: ComF family protein [Patescibacteria group bacterium]|nr:ComF family protein [Patescibacteria group bacterium]